MRGVTHLIAGLLLAVLFIPYAPNQLLGVFIILLGALIPDIDERSSILGRKIPFISFFTRHRTFFHSLFFAILCMIVLNVFLPRMYVWLFLAGYMSHLFLDAMTPMGVRPFWPSQVRIRGFIRTGGILEKMLFILFTALFLWLLLF